MPKLTGIFSGFVNMGGLKAEQINVWLKAKEQSFYLENFLGNRILYPQTIAGSASDLEIDLAIFREYVRNFPDLVFNPKSKKLIISEELIVRFPPLANLVSVILDVLNLETIVPIMVQRINGQIDQVGTVVSVKAKNGQSFVDVKAQNQVLKLEFGSVTILPTNTPQISLQINQDPPLSLTGGELGVVIDLKKT